MNDRFARAALTTLTATLALGIPALSWSQTGGSSGIFTCVDKNGRKLTSDRPIPDCVDREQKVLNPSGTVRAQVGPTLTAQERAAQEEKQREALEEQARKDEDKRRDRALLVRYPNKAVHDNERGEALKQISVVKTAAFNRVSELKKQRISIDAEMEFYKKDPSKAPAALKRQVDENVQSQAVQMRFIADQEGEIARVNARFDEELIRLSQLWKLRAPVTVQVPAKPTAKN